MSRASQHNDKTKALAVFIEEPGIGHPALRSNQDIARSRQKISTFFWFMRIFKMVDKEGATLLFATKAIPLDVLSQFLSYLYADLAQWWVRETILPIQIPSPITHQWELSQLSVSVVSSYRTSKASWFYRDWKFDYLLNSALNAGFVKKSEETTCQISIELMLEKMHPDRRKELLSQRGIAAIAHLKIKHQREGTMLQMALYSGDEDIVDYLKTMMDPAEFERQFKEVVRNALSSQRRGKLDAENAPLEKYFEVMQEVQKAEAKTLCNEAFQMRVVDGKEQFTINDETIATFKEKLESYVRNNPMHNPHILHLLFEIYEKLPGVDPEDCLFSQKAIGLAQALLPARWLQHCAQGIYYLGGGGDGKTLEPPLRSFMCRNSWVDVRSFIAGLGVDSFLSIFGWPLRRAGRCSLQLSPGQPLPDPFLVEIFVEKKQRAFRSYAESCTTTDSATLRPSCTTTISATLRSICTVM